MTREMEEEDNAEYEETDFVSDIENEAGNVDDERREYPVYVPMDSMTVDQHITSQADY